MIEDDAMTDAATFAENLATAVELLDHHAVARACEACDRAFVAVTRVDFDHVDALRVFADPESVTGDADAWTIDARLRIDTDCDESNPMVGVSGRMFPGRIEITSIVRI